MNVGIIGLGKMGGALAERFVKGGHSVFGFDGNQEMCEHAQKLGVTIVESVAALSESAEVIWLMVPAGDVVDSVIKSLLPALQPGHVIVDGGNSHPHDSVRRHAYLKKDGIDFIDCGTSGGVHGRELGFSLMIGGDQPVFEKLEPLFASASAANGYEYMGPAGAGHYVKMVHNGIEYALLQAYAEGFNLLHHGDYQALDLEKVTRVWQHGSIIRSWILDLARNVFKNDQTFENVSGAIGENKTGAWTLEEAQKHNIPVDLIEKSLAIRSWSREAGGNYATKLVALLRKEFGGHPLAKKD